MMPFGSYADYKFLSVSNGIMESKESILLGLVLQ
jgi:hypothetical protein